MKKGKVFTSGHIALVAMVIVLLSAVWLNMKYSSADNAKYMGEASFVSKEENGDAAMVGATPASDYFEKAKEDREKAYLSAEETLKEAIITAGQNEEALNDALNKADGLAKRKADEVAIENLLSAKGFNGVLAVIGNDSVTVIVERESVSAAESVQIQDAVASLCTVSLNNIKIVTVNG